MRFIHPLFYLGQYFQRHQANLSFRVNSESWDMKHVCGLNVSCFRLILLFWVESSRVFFVYKIWNIDHRKEVSFKSVIASHKETSNITVAFVDIINDYRS